MYTRIQALPNKIAALINKQSIFGLMVAITAFTLVDQGMAQSNKNNHDLLDRGSSAVAPASQLNVRGMTATLAVGSAGPGVTIFEIGVQNVTVAMAPAFNGNFYAPPDFPKSWYPFTVTGVFAWGGMLPATGTIALGVGVAPGPFSGGMGWAGFATAMSPLPVGMTSMVFSGPLTTPLPVVSPQGIACGLLSSPAAGPILGGLTLFAPTATVYTFNGPSPNDFLLAGVPALIHYVAGCFVSGATVPVELQAFSIE